MKALVRNGERERGLRLVPGLGVRAGQAIAGKYRVEELLGCGASGVVISARNIHLREPVVLKILASYTDGQEELVRRRLRKARIATRLRSKHVARIVDIGVTEDGMPYVASEHLQGKTLEVDLEERGPLPSEEAVRWILEACEGLAEAHAMGLVHGDLKPQNVFLALPKARERAREGEVLDPEADPRVLKILDFGTTSPLDSMGDQSASAFFASPAFLAPEQIQDPEKVDARADIWALGVLLYNLISGTLPFSADTVSGVIVAVVCDAPALLTDASYELAKIVASCLEKDPAKRPQDVKELAAALAPFAGANGERLSERVAAMLDAPPVSLPNLPPLDDEPLLLVTRRAGVDAPVTRPSKHVVTRSRWRGFGLVAAAAGLIVVGWAGTRTGLALRDASLDQPSTTTLTSEQHELKAGGAPVAPPAATAATTPSSLPDADPLVSFAPTPLQPSTPTPLVVTPTPVASPNNEAGARPLPPPPPMGKPQAQRLPAWLPTSREPAAPLAAPPRAATPARTAAASAADATYLRSLLSNRR
jgi:eukaryotic-like serine/threonine-protein kinase